MAANNGAVARLNATGRTRPVTSASTIVAPSRWRAVSPLGLRCHGPNGSKPVTNTFIKTSHCKTVYPLDCTVFWAVWIMSLRLLLHKHVFVAPMSIAGFQFYELEALVAIK